MSANSERKYIPLRVDQFQAGLKSPVNLYARVGDSDYVKLISAGEKPDRIKLTQPDGKKIKYLWVPPDEMNSLSKHQVSVVGAVINNSNYDLVQKSQFLAKASTTVFTEFARMDLNVQNYTLAQELSRHTATLVESHIDLYEILENLGQSSEELVKYSVTVSALSLVICTAMGWSNPITKEKLAIGGLLHRIGFLYLSKDLLKTKVEDYTQEQIYEFHTYPTEGMTRLNKIGYIPDDVIAIVHQHRERTQGKGFPLGLTDVRIHPLARVVAVAEALAFYIVPSINNDYTSMTPDKAYKAVAETQSELLNKEIFESVKKVLGRNSLRKN